MNRNLPRQGTTSDVHANQAVLKPRSSITTIRLTETAISKAVREAGEKGRNDLCDAGLPGLRLRVTPDGVATWTLACRDVDGRMRRL